MGSFFLIMAIAGSILFMINLIWFGWNIFLWVNNGIQFLLEGMNFVERLYESILLKWILWIDLIYMLIIAISSIIKKSYKTNLKGYYLKYQPIINPKISISLNVFNEEQVVEKVVNDFINQKEVSDVIVIDNHSTDDTAKIAKKCGAKTITKEINKGYADSWVLGLKESLKTKANIIAIADIDGTYNAYDLSKMVTYLENCDMVVGNRLVQSLTEKGNQNTMFYVWGNWALAKLYQLKYFNMVHRGHIQISDVGCSFRCFRREALEKIIEKFDITKDENINKFNDTTVLLYTNNIAIQHDLKIIEIPITFNRRVGQSKYTGSNRKGIKFGFIMLWYIIKN
jgi:glycosyltransferase involved in cell wall biosynthesis